jgi:hypothetical protein
MLKKKELRRLLLAALNSSNSHPPSKEAIRALHEGQRRERSQSEEVFLRTHGYSLMRYFADGNEISPGQISPKLVCIRKADSLEGHLFRLATLLWSVPVSRGYGRRLRYLVVDNYNSKIIGVLALGDPVFNLRCRDEWIGWDVNQRRERLAFVLDAYVLGAVPPYSMLLGSKLVGSLVASNEIQEEFRERYSKKSGIISQRRKNPHLVLATTTSALGRSSVYNRLRLPGIVEFIKTGHTDGWGHFLVSDQLFIEVRLMLKANGDSYSDNYGYGEGPSWRLRALRKACDILDIDGDLLRHGIQREAYGIPLAMNWRQVLLGEERVPRNSPILAEDIGKVAVKRWLVPRSERDSSWLSWSRRDTWSAITKYVSLDACSQKLKGSNTCDPIWMRL